MATAPGVATPDEYVGATIVREQTNLWADAWRRLKRNRLALVSTILLCGLVLVALVSLFWTPYPIWRQGVASTYQTPNSHFLLGADAAGRDIVSRLMVGAQISLEVGVGTQIVVALIGLTIGLIAGYFRGWLDGIFSTLIDAFLSVLGLGVQPPTPAWGAMAADGFHALRIAPHIVLAPAIALSLTLMAFNFLGDGLRDALDPRQKR